MKEIKTEQFIISRGQDSRVWVHSIKKGYGFWIYNSEIQELFFKHDVSNARKKGLTKSISSLNHLPRTRGKPKCK